MHFFLLMYKIGIIYIPLFITQDARRISFSTIKQIKVYAKRNSMKKNVDLLFYFKLVIEIYSLKRYNSIVF